ncbi:phosphoribosylformylglycinamidine cyclo-ligase [Paraburkholderia sp. GAS41]|jgi:phosphoribosylformylglycinamidine cyclo-ligase|uniref:AIR synthase related protein n=1 Tax=Paraburkholderia sp. GAS41 TaxID=3035134 RepID=UPI003D230BD4
MTSLNYEAAGVDYSVIDPLKIAAQKAAKNTAVNLARHGFRELEESRGESAYVVEMGSVLIASITECLGTKVLITDEVYQTTGKSHYAAIAQDTLAMAINDLITVGATPVSAHAYWAAGGNDWFADTKRATDLINGWQAACDFCGVAWGGGETPNLSGVVVDGRIDLAASCVGVVAGRERLTLGKDLAAGDAIVLLSSSGIHSNGVSLARKLADSLPERYATVIEDGRTYGEALLDPTVLYSNVTEAIFKAGIIPKYTVNVTGHGWRKLMRHPGEFTYDIQAIPAVPPVLKFITSVGNLDIKEAYSTLNMGAGFAIFTAPEDAARVVAIAEGLGITALEAGRVEAGPKRLRIAPLGIEFGAADLTVR